MISTLLFFWWKKIFPIKNHFQHMVMEIFSLFVSLFLIHYTVNAFQFNVNYYSGISYFHFLLLGEVALILPLTYFSLIIETTQKYQESHFFQTLLGLKLYPSKMIFISSLSQLHFSLIRIFCLMFIAHFFYQLPFSFTGQALFILGQLLGLFMFGLIALICSQIYLTFKKGVRWFYYLNSLLALFAGSYFPTTVFPSSVQLYLVKLIPQNALLELSRLSFFPEHYSRLSEYILVLIIISIFVGLVSVFFIPKIIEYRRRHNLVF